jgi:hypothetical protein
MRNEVRVVTALLVLASAVGPSWSADPRKVPRPSDKTASPQQTHAAGTSSIVSVPGGVDANGYRRPGLAEATALSIKECHGLGGKVRTDAAGVCASGYYCETVDQDNTRHGVCLSVSE